MEFVVKDKKAKGESKTKTFINIYLKEYEKIKFNKEILNVPFNNPSKEKIFKEFVSIATLELIILISSEKQISF